MIAFTPVPQPVDRPGPARLRLVPSMVPSMVPASATARVLPSTYRRRQALAAGFVALVIAAATVVLGLLGDGSRTVPEPSSGQEAAVSYVVQPGDTLWSIAAALDPHGDPRALVDRLAFENGGPQVEAGEEILVPRV